MGLQSFYIKIRPINNDQFQNEIINASFKKLKIKRNIYNKSIIINRSDNEIVLEGCFSNYSESLNYMINIIKVVSNSFKIKIIHELGINFIFDNNEIELINNIKEIYQKKYNVFQEEFGEIDFKAIPNENFFNKLKKYKKAKKKQSTE